MKWKLYWAQELDEAHGGNSFLLDYSFLQRIRTAGCLKYKLCTCHILEYDRNRMHNL